MAFQDDLLPFMAMTLVQLAYAVMTLSSKIAMEADMPAMILLAYRQVFATITLFPLAYYYERTLWPQITKNILFQIFLCSLFGATLNQLLYFIGLQHTTATIATAISNLTPAMTFIMSVPFGLEALVLNTRAGQAKVIGAVICIGGAMLLSLYQGAIVIENQMGPNWPFLSRSTSSAATDSKFFNGPLLILGSNICFAIWFIIQATLSATFAAPYTSSALLCFMASIQCIAIAICTNHQISDWSLVPWIRSVAAVFAGVVGSRLAICLMSWTIQKKGPVYVSVFGPLLLIIVALLSWGLLRENIYFGMILGSVFIVIGLYSVLWGKRQEMAAQNRAPTVVIDG